MMHGTLVEAQVPRHNQGMEITLDRKHSLIRKVIKTKIMGGRDQLTLLKKSLTQAKGRGRIVKIQTRNEIGINKIWQRQMKRQPRLFCDSRSNLPK